MNQLPEKLNILYHKGISAQKTGNLDYAITLFSTVLDSAPFYAPARTQLRLAEIQRFDSYKFQLWHKIRSYFPSFRAIFYHSKKDWLGMLNALEKPLRHYPKNYNILRRLVKAAEEADLPETVCSICETMYLINPHDINILKKLGKFYRILEQPEKAKNYYSRALAIAPLDYEARKGMQDLAALGTITKGWEKEGTYREKIRDESQADLFEKEARLVRSEEDIKTIIEDTKKRLTEQPENLPLIKKLAELYVSSGNYSEALKLYEKAAKLDPADTGIGREILNVKIAQLDSQGLIEEKQKLILQGTQQRVKEFPSYLPLRYEMGSIYVERGMFDDAIAEFQLSIKDPKYKILSLNNLGLCFFKKGINDLAINQFQKAAAELHEWDEIKKEVTYNLGTVYEAMGDKQKAIAEFKKIYEQDINYKDISKKIS